MSSTTPKTTLHGYFRSSAAYRVRIALNLKGIAYDSRTYHLRKGDQRTERYLAVNPQGLVPTLQTDGALLTQSLAIVEYLEDQWPTPPLLPSSTLDRARVRAMAQIIACDIHPIDNLPSCPRLVRSLGTGRSFLTGSPALERPSNRRVLSWRLARLRRPVPCATGV